MKILALILVWTSFQWASAENLIPLRFDPESTGLQAVGPSLTWSLTKKKDFVVGGERFDSRLYSVAITSNNPDSVRVDFNFNAKLFPSADLFLYDSKGKIIAVTKIPDGQGQISRSFFKADYKIQGEGFKFCIYSEADSQQSLVCSPLFNDQLKLTLTPPKMVINGQSQSLQGMMTFTEESPVELTWLNEEGLSFHHVSKAPKTVFYDVSKTDPSTLSVRSYGSAPIANTKKVTEERTAFWQHTLGDLRIFSETQIPLATPIVPVREKRGLIFTYELRFQKLPLEASRLYLRERSPHSTYGSKLVLRGKKPKDLDIESSEYSVKSAMGSEDFEWLYQADKKFEYNESKILTDQTFTYEVMRMPNTYLFAGLGVSLGADGNLASFYDVHASHWLNEPFGENYYFSRARWGLMAGYYSTLSTSVSADQLAVSYLDIIYRLSPGVEAWDEGLAITWGGTQETYSTARTLTLFGPGIYWTRSLPEWFNSVLGISSFFRKPKWVDISAHAYVLSPDTTLTGSSVQIRALGRIDITHNAYFEAGWGIITSTSVDNTVHQMVALTAGRGYLGYGYRF